VPRLLLFGDAWDREAVLQECRAAGLDGYLPKPVSIAKLVAAVRELTRPIYDPTAAADGEPPWPPTCPPRSTSPT
jgi:DNA-binding NarL/FixJ family response regulator